MYNLMSDESLLAKCDAAFRIGNTSFILKTISEHSESFKNAFNCMGKPTKTCKYIY
ncbi:endothelin-converting enzyme 2-like [Aphis craccivora]|uniref:Endothelin-converting enzyme 2-like n=1 Tax=Aphis craccivora TaxID=307492 RepID=A0A6G0VV28_APHCR|nr:endothelin-converting enzyme 2-like [Aphis craccivora]